MDGCLVLVIFFQVYIWISISLTFDSDFKFLIPISLILIPSFLALFISLPVFCLSFFLKFNKLCLVLIFSILLACSEFIRGSILTIFPWNLFIYSFFKQSILYPNAFYIWNLWSFIAFFLLPSIFIFLIKIDLIKSLHQFHLLFFVSFFIGNSRLNEKNIISKFNEGGLVKIVSSKVEIDRFYNTENEENIINQLIALSDPDKDVPTLFIWPEGVITSTYLKDISQYKKLFEKFSDKHLILLGINNIVTKDKSRIYNSLALVDNELNLKSVYYKNNLVPFGEFLPLESVLSKIDSKYNK